MKKSIKWLSIIALIAVVVCSTVAPVSAAGMQFRVPAKKVQTLPLSKIRAMERFVQQLDDLKVSLSPSTPLSATVIANQLSVPVIKLKLEASNREDVIVRELSLTLEGLFNNNDFLTFDLVNSEGMTLASSMNIENNKIRFVIPAGNLVVQRNSAKELSVTVDISNMARGGDTFNLSLQSWEDVNAIGRASGNQMRVGGRFPVRGNRMTIEEETLTVNLSAATPVGRTIVIGEQDVPVLEVGFMAGHAEDISIQSVDMNINGPENTISMARLYDDQGNVISSTLPRGNSIHFEMNSDVIVQRDSRIDLSVEVDITPVAERGSTFSLSIEENNDVVAIGDASGNAIRVVGNFPVVGTTMTVVGSGELSVMLDPSTPHRFMLGQGQELLTFDLTALEDDILVRGLTIETQGVSELGEGMILDSNMQVLGRDFAPAAGGNFNFVFADNLVIEEGETKVLTFAADIFGRGNGILRVSLQDIDAMSMISGEVIEAGSVESVLTF